MKKPVIKYVREYYGIPHYLFTDAEIKEKLNDSMGCLSANVYFFKKHLNRACKRIIYAIILRNPLAIKLIQKKRGL